MEINDHSYDDVWSETLGCRMRKLEHGWYGTTHQYPNYLNRTYPDVRDNEFVLTFSGSHNASVTLARGRQILCTIELERLMNVKNVGIAQYKVPKQERIFQYMRILREYFERNYGVREYKFVIMQNSDVIIDDKRHMLEQYFPSYNYIHTLHHLSHAAGTFYQSPYREAIVFSSDGGGSDGIFHVYHAKRGEEPKFIAEYVWDLGFAYMVFGEYLGDIKYEPALPEGNLVYSGKIMGLVSYGKVRKEWVPAFIKFYQRVPSGNDYKVWIKELGNAIGVDFTTENRLTGQLAYDVAATSQHAFESLLFHTMKPHVEAYPGLPICFTGGCALNILANTAMKKHFKRDVFVGPNPNDCGQSLGMMLNWLKPDKPYDATYCGPQLLDTDCLMTYLEELPYDPEPLNVKRLAELIARGKIMGVARSKAEHGPRALGNRSILCNPVIPEMKDILNAKVKHREWYRPFAPVVRLEDVNKYFEWEGESRWMSFAPQVREEYKSVLPSITHVDGTARVQTVTREQNGFLYDLLTEIEKITGVGVLLNTSFNVDGKPILSTIRDALLILEKTEMDGLVINNTMILKPEKTILL